MRGIEVLSRAMSSRVLMCLAFTVAACGNRPESNAPSPAASATAAEPVASAAPPAASAEPAEPPKKRKPFELYNACTDVATIALGEDPKAADAGKRTVAPSGSLELPRDADGNQTVHLLDAKGESLVKVRVTRGMKRVEIGRSCRTLDAR